MIYHLSQLQVLFLFKISVYLNENIFISQHNLKIFSTKLFFSYFWR